MTVDFTLNEKKVSLLANPFDTLLDALLSYGLTDLKAGCREGVCGSCMVLLNDKAVPSCKVLLPFVKGADVVTFGHFFLSDNYTDIKKGFQDAGIHLCGFCDAGKVFLAYDIIKNNKELNKKQIQDYIQGYKLCCLDSDTYLKGIVLSQNYFQKRLLRRGAKKR